MSSSLLCKGIQMNGEAEEGLQSGTPRLQSSRGIMKNKNKKSNMREEKRAGRKTVTFHSHNTNSEWVHMHSIVATETRLKSHSDV